MQISSKVNAEIVEVLRRETVGGVVVYHASIDATDTRQVRTVTTPTQGSPQKTVAIRAGRLLNSLAKLAAFRRSVGNTSRIAWQGVVEAAADLIIAQAYASAAPVGRADLRRWAARHVPEASRPAVDEIYADAEDAATLSMASPAVIGGTVNLQLHEWFQAGHLWGVHPVDATADDLREIRRTIRRERHRIRARVRREAAGATPRANSLAALARELGVSRPTLYSRMRAAGCETVEEYRRHLSSTGEEFYTFVSPYLFKEETTGDESVKPDADGPDAAPPARLTRRGRSSAPGRPPQTSKRKISANLARLFDVAAEAFVLGPSPHVDFPTPQTHEVRRG